MKKTFCFIFILLCAGLLFAFNLEVGPSVLYSPFDNNLSDKENIKDFDNYEIGLEADLRFRFLIIENDTYFKTLYKNVAVDFVSYINSYCPVTKFFDVSVGLGLNGEIRKTPYRNGKLAITHNGIALKDTIKSFKVNGLELLGALRVKAGLQVRLFDKVSVGINYIVNPSEVYHLHRLGESFQDLARAGSISLAVKYTDWRALL